MVIDEETKRIAEEVPIWNYLNEEPDLIEEIITNNDNVTDVKTRTILLIQIIKFTSIVEAFASDERRGYPLLKAEERIIRFKYYERSMSSLLYLIESNSDSMRALTNYIIWHIHECEPRICISEAFYSLFNMLTPWKMSPETTTNLVEIFREMVKQRQLFDNLKYLVTYWNTVQKHSEIEKFFLELLDHPIYDESPLQDLVKMKSPPINLVKKVKKIAKTRWRYRDDSRERERKHRRQQLAQRLLIEWKY